jgi:GT2 family glycosyltransferase
MNAQTPHVDARPIAVSVVVASFSGEALLTDCLASLVSQRCEEDGVEVIAATTLAGESLARVRARYPSVRFVEQTQDANVFQLRAAGARAAEGQLVLLTEDHTRAAAGWMAALQAAHGAGHHVVGGPVDNGNPNSAYAWGLYFCEYGIHAPPMREGPAPVLSGLNIGYDRNALQTTRDLWARELRENEINDALRTAGQGELWMVPAAVVDTRLGMSPREAMRHLAAGGRHYGRYRAQHASPLKRSLLILGSPLVPALLFCRIGARTLHRRPARLLHVLQSFPWIALLLGSWCFGEAAGYLTVRRSARATSGAPSPARRVA